MKQQLLVFVLILKKDLAVYFYWRIYSLLHSFIHPSIYLLVKKYQSAY